MYLPSIVDGAVARIRELSGRLAPRLDLSTRSCDAILVLAIALLAVIGLAFAYDTYVLIWADALYPIMMLDVGLLDFRPPPPNRLFPDVGVHWLASFLTDGLFAQKAISGLTLFALTVGSIGYFKGPRVFTVAVVVLIAAGFQFVDSASHYTLPFLVLVYQLSQRNRMTDALALGVIVFSDVMVLLPVWVMLAGSQHPDRALARGAAIAAGFVASMLYSDFGASYVALLAVLPVWVAAVAIATRLGLRVEFSFVVAVVLVLATIAGIVPPRYGLPVATSIVVALTPLLARPALSWRYLAAPAAVAAVFYATADMSGANRITAAYDCLADTLKQRGIDTIAADHWSSKPLYLAAKRRGLALTIAQTDFREGDTQLWMAPYSFHGKPSIYGLRERSSCALRGNDPTYCGQDGLVKVESHENVCGEFDLFRYSVPVPIHYEPEPATKLDAIRRQLGAYIAKALRIAGL